MNFFPKILKQKKTIIFALLFLIILGIFLPKPASAGFWCNVGILVSPTGAGLLGCSPVDTIKDAYNSTVGQAVSSVAQDLGIAVLKGLADGVYYIGQAIGWLGQHLFGIAIQILDWPITTFDVFTKGWAAVRDIANMLIVLGLVVVGIATTLRIQDYQAKKLLLPLIVIALLINFSGLFCGIIIDASNIAVKTLTQQGVMSGSGEQATIYNTIVARVNDTFAQDDVKNNVTKYVKADIEFALVFIMVGIVFFYLSLILLARYGVLAVLYILSPLAFICWVFPQTQKIWTEWWENFIKWTFIGVGASFFVWISDSVLKGLLLSNNNKLSDVGLLVVLLILVVGFKITTRSSGMGASAVIGLAGAALTGGAGLAAGMALGAAKGGGKMLGKGADAASGGRLSAAGQRISSATGRAMENLGLRKTGTTALSRAGELGESEKRYSALIAQGDLASVQRTARGEGMNKSPKERGGAAAALLKSKNFDTTNAKEVASLTHFQSQGGNLSEYSAKDPRLSYHDISATRNTVTKEKAKGNILTEERAAQKNVDDGYARLGVRGMRDLSANAMDVNFFRNTKPEKNTKASDEYSDAQIKKQKQYITPGTPERKEYEATMINLRKSGIAKDMIEYRRMRDHLIEMGKNPNLK